MLSFAPRFNFGFSSDSRDPQNREGGAGEDSAKRSDLMGQILAFNPTASTDFLSQFDCTELGEYLEHLTSAARPRGRLARRVRPANTPGITASDSWRN
jgi:hypothetical protein